MINNTKKSDKNDVSVLNLINTWWRSHDRLNLLKWSAGFFSITTLLILVVGLLYISAYTLPVNALGLTYTLTAYTSHFASIALIIWVSLVIPLIILFPYKKFIIPFSIALSSFILCIILLDAQLFVSHRFHFSMLTIKILGWKTWGFGMFYLLMIILFNSLVAKSAWNNFVTSRKKLYLTISIPVTLLFLLFTHVAHMWADATGYVDITRFTTTLPLFYPSTSKRFMVKHGFADMSNRRNLPKNFNNSGKDFYYPQKPLEFLTDKPTKNILLIAIDAMRADVMNEVDVPKCMAFAQNYGTIFTNHHSGGNSTKMGTFTLFYGISPTYQQYVESNKRSPVIMNRLLETGCPIGIFTSYKLYSPANLDVTAFVKVPNLRLETVIPGPEAGYRNDSAITEQWKSWLDQNSAKKPFFGFLFYDALSTESYPPSYESLVQYNKESTSMQKKFVRYKTSLKYVDSLVASVLEDLWQRGLSDSTVVIITSDHGEEFDDNGLGFSGHGSAYSNWQIRSPLVTFWPGSKKGVISKRTSHYDIVATLIKDVFLAKNPESDYSSGNNLFSENSWNWLLVGSYYNFAILEPEQVTIQFPGGYYEVRDNKYQIVQKPKMSSNITDALNEMGRFFKH